MKTRFIIALWMLLLSGNPAAQQAPHVCGAGPGPNEVMAGVQPGGSGIAPTPLCYWKSGAQQPAASPVRWANRWGAIAVAQQNPVVGVAANAKSKREAQRTALNDCQSRGGVGCQLQIEYFNQCGVLVVAGSQYNAARAATVEEATNIGMKVCGEGNVLGCRVYYSGCSLPVQVQ